MRRILCDGCGVTLAIKNDHATGVSCPKCGQKTVVRAVARAAEASQKIASGRAPAAVALKSPKARPVRISEDEDEDEVGGKRAQRRKPGHKRKKKPDFPWLLTASLGGGLAAIMLAVGLMIFTHSRRAASDDRKGAQAAPVASAPAKVPAAADATRAEAPHEGPAPDVPQPDAPRIIAKPGGSDDPPLEIVGLDLGFKVPRRLPQAQEKRRQERFAFIHKTLLEAYDRVGKKSPRWDAPARSALTYAADMFFAPNEGKGNWDGLHPLVKKAIEAGCDDPLVLYLYAKSFANRDDEETVRRQVDAGWAMEKSAYPVYRRLAAVEYAAKSLLVLSKRVPSARADAERLLGIGVKLAAQWPKTEGDAFHRWSMQFDAIAAATNLQIEIENDVPKALAIIARKVGNQAEMQAAFLRVRADVMTNYGWQARGNGVANTVSEEGWRLFGERLLEARRDLEKAWRLNPADGAIASMMILNCKAIGHGDDDEVHTWFERAMTADPDNLDACLKLLDYLDPKWHGSPEALVAFGRECRDSENTRAWIPLLVAEAHLRAAWQAPLGSRRRYMNSERVWNDIKSVYERHLALFPEDKFHRFQYAVYCWHCGHPDIGGEQFALVGDDIYNFLFNTPAELRHIREQSLTVKRQLDSARGR